MRTVSFREGNILKPELVVCNSMCLYCFLNSGGISGVFQPATVDILGFRVNFAFWKMKQFTEFSTLGDRWKNKGCHTWKDHPRTCKWMSGEKKRFGNPPHQWWSYDPGLMQSTKNASGFWKRAPGQIGRKWNNMEEIHPWSLTWHTLGGFKTFNHKQCTIVRDIIRQEDREWTPVTTIWLKPSWTILWLLVFTLRFHWSLKITSNICCLFDSQWK